MINSLSQTIVTGLYRSGTEYIINLIGSHPELSATMYHINALRFIKDRFDPIHERVNYIKAVHFLSDRSERRYGVTFDPDKVVEKLGLYDKINTCLLYDIVMTNMHLSVGSAHHWAEKCQLVWREIPYFLRDSSNGYAVHIVRDPRSVLASFKKFTNSEYPLYLSSVFNSFDSMSHALKQKDNDRVVILKFEDVLNLKLEEVSKIWSMIGLSQKDENIFNPDLWLDAYGNKWTSNSLSSPLETYKFNKKNAINEWRTGLNPSEIAFTEEICGELMELFGYEVSGVGSSGKIYNVIYSNHWLSGLMNQYVEMGEGVQSFPSNPIIV